MGGIISRLSGGLGLLALSVGNANAGGVPVVKLDTLTVTDKAELEDAARSSTEGYVTAEQLRQRPISRSGELLEFVPGLIVTQHSGEGKANQYFLRGFNLDHGTDFYSEVDGVPVNMRTHGHGQGYADINFMIPELIGSLDYRKGPYYADVGDFAAAGSASLRYVDALPHTLLEGSVGEYGYRRALVASSPELSGGHLLLAGEAAHYDGAYDLKQDARAYKGLIRYHHGSDDDGYTIGLQGYSIDYTAPDQIPMRAVKQGLISEYGYVDPSDGGEVRRFSLDGDWRHQLDNGYAAASAYAMRYKMDLYSDFTYYLNDPDDNSDTPTDQFEQYDRRWVWGGQARRYWLLPTAVPADLEAGLQLRYDDISPVGLYQSQSRRRTDTVRQDAVKESSAALYLTSKQRWLPWMRTDLGLRADTYHFDVDSDLAANSGTVNDHLFSPKAAMVLGPWRATELFLNYGIGFHSNDARGTTITLDPTDPTLSTAADRVTPLVKVHGAEVGITSAAVDNLRLSTTLWQLKSDSELVYVGDAGSTEVGPPSTRRGVEFSSYWTPLRWLAVDADYAWSHARFDVPSSEGRYIPNAIAKVASLGISIPETTHWSGGLRLRYFGPAPLVEDNSARSPSTMVVNGQAGYHWQSMHFTLAVLNLFDSHDHDITYYYESRLPGEAADGVSDYHFHPVEPRALRFSIRAEL